MEKKRKKSSFKPADIKSRLEFGKYIASHIQGQIVLADRKAAWIFSVLAVATGALLTKIVKIDLALINAKLILSLTIFVIILITAAFIQLIRVIYPRLTKSNTKSVYYFGDIIKNKKDQYTSKGVQLSEEEIITALYQESYDLASIASKKFNTLHKGVILTVIALISTILLLLLVM